MTRKHILLQGALLASASTLLAGNAWAQSSGTPVAGAPSADTQTTPPSAADQPSAAADQDTRGIQDIVVTARRVEENLQTVPVAVTALNTRALEVAQVTSAVDLQRTAPSVSIRRGAPSASTFTFISIRGQGNLNPGVANDPAIATYLDGVYIPRPSQGVTDLDDIQRAEILRGPQGTLFGRNTIGGALNIITNDPNGNLSVTARGEYGNYGYFSGGAIVNLPIKDDELGIRATYKHSQHSGYARNTILDRDQNDFKSDFVRGKLRFAPSGSAFSLVLSGDYNKIHDSGVANSLGAVNPTTGAGLSAVFQGALAPLFGALQANGLPVNVTGINLSTVYGSLTPYLHTRRNWYKGYSTGFAPDSVPDGGVAPFDNLEAWGGSAIATVDLDNITFKSITGYRYSNSTGLIDLDATPVDILATKSGYKSRQFSQEVQASGKVGNRFNYITGLYYSYETGREFSDFQTFGFLNSYVEDLIATQVGAPAGAFSSLLPAPLTPVNSAYVKNVSTGLFAQGYFNITEKLRLTAGLRWSWDVRRVVLSNLAQIGLPGDTPIPTSVTGVNCVNPGGGDAATCKLPRQAGFDYPAYTIGLDYKASDTLFLYAKHSRASKAGGFNLRQGAETVPAFAPETTRDAEIGFKFDTPNRIFRLNAAAFYAWSEGVQRNASAVVNNLSTQYFRNAGKTDVYGFEVEALLNPIDNLQLNGNFSLLRGHYVDGTYFDDLGGGVIVDRSDEPLPQLPHQQFNVGATYTIPASFGDFSLHADYAYVSSQYTNTVTAPPGLPPIVAAQYDIANRVDRTPGYGLLNARVSLALKNGLEVYAFGRNLTDKKYLVNTFSSLYTSVGVSTEYVGDPATYGVGLKVSFGPGSR